MNESSQVYRLNIISLFNIIAFYIISICITFLHFAFLLCHPSFLCSSGFSRLSFGNISGWLKEEADKSDHGQQMGGQDWEYFCHPEQRAGLLYTWRFVESTLCPTFWLPRWRKRPTLNKHSNFSYFRFISQIKSVFQYWLRLWIKKKFTLLYVL